MKKSFLKTCILLCFFSIFLIGMVEETSAQINSEALVLDSGYLQLAETGTLSATSSFWRKAGENILNWTPVGLASNNFYGFNLGRAITKPETTKSFFDCAINPIACAIGTGSYAIVKLSSLLLYLTGNVFDMIVKYTINDNFLFKSIESSINISWKIVRDIANIFIVFALLYLGIKTIFNGNGFAETKTLISIIIAAILINFSLLITQTVFDISNLIGSQIAEQITFENKSQMGGIVAISEGLTSMIRPDKLTNMLLNHSEDGWDDIWNKVQTAIFSVTAILLLTAVFLGASILLMYRFLIFTVLMITSPIGITSKFIPWFEKIGESWWKALKSQAIVLPAFLLTLYISVMFVSVFSANLGYTTISSGSLTNGTAEQIAGGLVTFVFNYLLIIGFLLLPLIVPGKIGAAGSDMMTGVANWTTNKIKNAPKRFGQRSAQVAAGTTARAGRLVLGKGLGSFADNKALKEKAQKKGPGGFFARQAIKASDGLRNKTYDIRNLDTVKKSEFGKGMGSGIDSYSKKLKTYKEDLDKKKKDEMKMFGFDKLKGDPAKIAAAEMTRDRLETESNNAKSAYIANPNATTKARYELAEKTLEEAEANVGKLKKYGDSQYQENVVDPRRNLGWMEHVPLVGGGLQSTIVGIMNKTTIRNTAYTQSKDDLYKKLKEEGQSKSKKQKKAENNWIDSAASGSTSIPPPPTIPPATPPPPTT